MREKFTAAVALHTLIVGACSALLLVSCGGGGGGGGGDRNVDNGSSGGSGGGSTPLPSLPTATSSSASAYVVPTAPGWKVVPLLTVGDKVGTSGYAMVGKPDGLGALPGRISSTGELTEPDRYLTVLMNHELPVNAGAARMHGTRGAFVSQWTVDIASLKISEGRDLTSRVQGFSNGAWHDATGTLAFDRLCSADLPATGAFFNSQTGNGFSGRLFTNGEEAGTEGRAFAHVATSSEYGTAYELPYLGRFSYENVVAHPNSGDTTFVVSLDDSSPGQVYVYVGTKSKTGNPVERAGLHGGKLYGVRVVDGGSNYSGAAVARESKGAVNGRFELVDVSDRALGPGTELQAASVNRGVTEFARPEDGAWDTRNGRSFLWATTGATVDGNVQSARLYRLTFDSIENPTGGTIELVLDSASLVGTDGATARGFDNLAVAGDGRVVVQEDPGASEYVAKTWLVDPATGSAIQALESDRNRFVQGGSGFLTMAEENSGVIEITDLVRSAGWSESGRRYYLGVTQAHHAMDATLVEGGQLYLFASPP